MLRQLVIVALVGLALGAPGNKIDGFLRQRLNHGTANVVVSFKADTEEVLQKIDSMRFATRGAKITTMMSQLDALRVESQKNALSLLEFRAIPHTSLWINNRIYINGADAELVEAIAALPEVAEVREEIVVQIEEPISSNQTINAEWGVEKIEATAAWALPGGNNGAGVVVCKFCNQLASRKKCEIILQIVFNFEIFQFLANIDTGVRATHQALRNNFRSSYGWFDPYTRTATPTDGNGHGTHTM